MSMSERVFERTNQDDKAFFVAGFAATAHWRHVPPCDVSGHHDDSEVRQ